MPGYAFPQRAELLEHLLACITLVAQFVETGSEPYYTQYQALEKELLHRYKNALLPYHNKKFDKYFWFEIVLVEKDIVSTETFNAVQPDEQRLTVSEQKLFLQLCSNSIEQQLHYLYLYAPAESNTVTLNDTLSFNVTDEPDKEITKARQLLAIHYFLKIALEIEARDNNSASGVARFIYLLTGTKFTTIQNSEIYKKYLRMPNYKKDNQLIEDLKFVRSYFVDLKLDKAVEMIDNEIKMAIKESPYGKRKKED